MQRLIDAEATQRLRDRDPTLFTEDVDSRLPIQRRLGWTDLATKATGRLPLLEQLRDALTSEGAADLVLLGMGGSSLAPLVMERVFGSAPGMPRLHVLDTTFPGAVLDLTSRLTPESAYFIIASKSGTTIEPLSLYAIFRKWADDALGRNSAGKHFIVITDPGSPLDKLRRRESMRTSLSAPPTVGGRYSALSMFGLAPAALIGVDVAELIARALLMESACWADPPESPGAQLAAWIVDAWEAGRDKLTLALSPRLSSVGLWIEQLVAESTGKIGRGIVPVIEPLPSLPTGYLDDRAVAVIRLGDDDELARWRASVDEQTPTFEIVLPDTLDLGAEFVRWEVAVALAGALIGVNPFDEPNVGEAKRATQDVLAGELRPPRAAFDLDGTWVTYAGRTPAPVRPPQNRVEALAPLLSEAQGGDYLAVLAYLPQDEALLVALRAALKTWSVSTGVAAMLEVGPRYLHSTGQLHKGGPDEGVFLVLTARDAGDVAIPGQRFTLGALFRAQAEGDLATLAKHGKRVARVDLPDLAADTLLHLAEAIAGSAC